MISYKERFKAEYWQTKIRYEKLHRMTVKYEAGTLDFEPDCELSLLHGTKKVYGPLPEPPGSSGRSRKDWFGGAERWQWAIDASELMAEIQACSWDSEQE